MSIVIQDAADELHIKAMMKAAGGRLWFSETLDTTFAFKDGGKCQAFIAAADRGGACYRPILLRATYYERVNKLMVRPQFAVEVDAPGRSIISDLNLPKAKLEDAGNGIYCVADPETMAIVKLSISQWIKTLDEYAYRVRS